jgi:hypothetical protein
MTPLVIGGESDKMGGNMRPSTDAVKKPNRRPLGWRLAQWAWMGLVLLAGWACGQAQPQEMTELARVFRVVARDSNVRYAETIKALPRQYEAEVAALRDRFQQLGDLDGVLAAVNELKRYQAAMAGERDPFELAPEMPPGAIVAKPPELRRLQEQYRGRIVDASTQRKRDITDLAGKYVKNLQKVQSDLTRAGRFDEAVVVKQESERLQQALQDDTLMRLVERMIAELAVERAPAGRESPPTPGGETTEDGVHIYGSVPDWAKWKYVGASRFARERTQINHANIPEELRVLYNEKTGRGNFSGRCAVDSAMVGISLARWFGKALVWLVDDTRTLNATFVLTSRQLSAGEDHGPSAQLAVLANGVPLRSINVNLQDSETTLRLVKDPNSPRAALMWPRGSITETFELPANSEIGVLLGVTVRNPGELCDTSFVIQ